ncbi:MAG: DUF4932 domain-containing protein [Planctomycetia bacterium]|nr:DUF4932 domain-containing protein [Planctomycetia bacterium]
MKWFNIQNVRYWIIKLAFLMVFVTNSKSATINVNIDPRLELLSVVQIISNYNERYFLMTNFDFKYKQDILEYFSKYKDHKAVKLFDKMSHLPYGYFNAHRPPELMVHLSNPPELNIQYPIPTEIVKSSDLKNIIFFSSNMKRLNAFIDALRDFCVETGFMDFYNDHKEFYNTVSSDAKNELSRFDINKMEEYFGISQNGYNIILVPLFHGGGFAARILGDNGKYDIYSIIGPVGVSEGVPYFGDNKSLTELCSHEFNHSFINMDDNYYLFKPYRSLYKPIKQRMKSNAYPNWKYCVEEHIDRAVVIRLLSKEFGDEVADEKIKYEFDRGFIYVEGITNKLKEYESQRDIYPSIVDFYPEIAKIFKDYYEKKH